jgi:hypothetical protein
MGISDGGIFMARNPARLDNRRGVPLLRQKIRRLKRPHASETKRGSMSDNRTSSAACHLPPRLPPDCLVWCVIRRYEGQGRGLKIATKSNCVIPIDMGWDGTSRTAKPCTPVQFWSWPPLIPSKTMFLKSLAKPIFGMGPGTSQRRWLADRGRGRGLPRPDVPQR